MRFKLLNRFRWRVAWCFVLFYVSWRASGDFANPNDFFDYWQNQIVIAKNEIQERLHSKETPNENFDCSYHVCLSDTKDANTKCLVSHHTEDINCGRDTCGSMELSTDYAYVTTPDDTAPSSFSASVRKDLRLVGGLAETFKEVRNYSEGTFEPWVYLGTTESGVFTIWPGHPRSQEENGSCTPYDPRLRPWWRSAAWKSRNVIILLDRSQSMDDVIKSKPIKRWDMAKDMISKLMKTLSENDRIQIILFDEEIERLDDSALLIKATPDAVEALQSKLEDKMPVYSERGLVDFGKAFDKALEAASNAVRSGSSCKTHIFLFTDSRDCTSSSLESCATKEYFGLKGEFVTQNIKYTLEYIQVLRNYYKLSDNQVKLFSYSFSPDSSPICSYLACQMNGISVDIERVLREEEISEPLNVMQGYLHTIALQVAASFGEDKMAVSEAYYDDSGLGLMNTLTMPVYYHPYENCPFIQFGVIGVDMTAAFYQREGIVFPGEDFNLSVSNWNFDLDCFPLEREASVCEMQVIRGSREECVYPLEPFESSKCYSFMNHTYFINYTNLVPLQAAKDFCAGENGELVAPTERDEIKFLATIVPPDGAWVDLRLDDNNMIVSPSGEELPEDLSERIKITCNPSWDEAFFMDARNYVDNFQCSQALQFRPAICKFKSDPPNRICTSKEIREVTEENYVNTISTCGMEHCIKKDENSSSNLNPKDLICEDRPISQYDFDAAACCADSDLDKFCPLLTLGDDDSNRYFVPVIYIVPIVIGILLALLCLICFCRSKGRFGRKSPPGSAGDVPLGFIPKPVPIPSVLNQMSTFEHFVAGPFDPNAYGGKRPELVVNIEVKILNNNWEKVGGYGRVRQGEYTDSTGKVHRVAVKFVDALAPNAAWEALKNEFDILSSIPLHPNIVKPIGAYWGDRSENSSRYIVEELMHTNLGDLMHEVNPPPYPGKVMKYRDWIKIFIDIVSGLEHLHKHKIIHFDLKPRNVLLDEKMNAKIADFGCSKSKFDTYIELSKMGGTPPYLAPECWMLFFPANQRTEVSRIKIDIYSFGVIMWECLNGGRSLSASLYRQTSEIQSLDSKIALNPDRIQIRDSRSSDQNQGLEIQYHLREDIPASLRELVTRCVRVDFDSRPTCGEILTILRSLMRESWIDQEPPLHS